ncbi:hypothetical protein CWE15_03060 [Aliidiomarina taiwanensis]|uniref:YtkA-like domain-containing protein n=2 Tax=Aliidiomarina taiwanensis TaxID=946228 RepID=A0A432XA19_9GAMM|nr:hypothetical protein CWE15_03060 [Aliidiomarina taiwanensis]
MGIIAAVFHVCGDKMHKINVYKAMGLAVVLSVSLVSCTKATLPSTEVAFCALGSIPSAQCQVQVGDQTISFFSTSPSMPEETDMTLFAQTPSEWTLNKAVMRGESMYMGEIPIVWTPQGDGRWQADLRIAACAHPGMVWRIDFDIETEAGHATTAIHFPVAAHGEASHHQH